MYLHANADGHIWIHMSTHYTSNVSTLFCILSTFTPKHRYRHVYTYVYICIQICIHIHNSQGHNYRFHAGFVQTTEEVEECEAWCHLLPGVLLDYPFTTVSMRGTWTKQGQWRVRRNNDDRVETMMTNKGQWWHPQACHTVRTAQVDDFSVQSLVE